MTNDKNPLFKGKAVKLDIDKSKTLVRDAISPYLKEVTLAKKEVVIEEGEQSKQIFLIKSGCLRSWFNQDGKDVSCQFFLPGSMFGSFESMMFDEPSPYSYESILPSVVDTIPKSKFFEIITADPKLKDAAFTLVCSRMRDYQRLFLSRIKDTPEQRYQDLIASNPELIRLIPQHYIATYLGITSVSLSRIRCRS